MILHPASSVSISQFQEFLENNDNGNTVINRIQLNHSGKFIELNF